MKYQNWSLFLDRDGVINNRLPGQYVDHWEDFHFIDGTLDTFPFFTRYFSRVFVVTNQQGIGKGLMTEAQLKAIHQRMQQSIESYGGKIDAIYFCPELATLPDNCRKPNPSMALAAKKDFPDIEFSKSFMVGDSISDMEFGKKLGMLTVLVESNAETLEMIRSNPPLANLIDWRCKNLAGFVNLLP